MAKITTLLSTVADGTMYTRNNPTDAKAIANREAFLKKHRITMDQTTRVRVNYTEGNFCRYYEIGEQEKGQGMRGDDVVISDALVTKDLNHALLLPVADCVGAVIYDPTHEVLMLSHLGRHSLEQNGGVQSVEFLKKKYGSDPSELKVWLTPAPNKETYPIWALDNKGMKEATFEQLRTAGIKDENITNDPRDTVTDLTFYSYSEFLKGNRTEDGDHVIVAVMT